MSLKNLPVVSPNVATINIVFTRLTLDEVPSKFFGFSFVFMRCLRFPICWNMVRAVCSFFRTTTPGSHTFSSWIRTVYLVYNCSSFCYLCHRRISVFLICFSWTDLWLIMFGFNRCCITGNFNLNLEFVTNCAGDPSLSVGMLRYLRWLRYGSLCSVFYLLRIIFTI